MSFTVPFSWSHHLPKGERMPLHTSPPGWHTPAIQVPVHGVSHPPQLASSVMGSTQALPQIIIIAGQGVQGVGQSPSVEQGFTNALLPKSALNANASVPSTSWSQSKLPSQKSCATAAHGTSSNKIKHSTIILFMTILL
jgi:hypothetical protein